MSALQNTACCKVRNLFSIKIDQPQKGYSSPNATEVCQHFNNLNHTLYKHGKFIPIEQLINIKNTSAEVLKQSLR